jgi:uncharacterized membrane protein YgcG
MMRLAWILVGLAAISASVVHLRCRQIQSRAEMQHLDNERLLVRRTLWDQQLRLGDLSTPQNIRRLTLDWPLELVGPEDLDKDPLAGPPAQPVKLIAPVEPISPAGQAGQTSPSPGRRSGGGSGGGTGGGGGTRR